MNQVLGNGIIDIREALFQLIMKDILMILHVNENDIKRFKSDMLTILTNIMDGNEVIVPIQIRRSLIGRPSLQSKKALYHTDVTTGTDSILSTSNMSSACTSIQRGHERTSSSDVSLFHQSSTMNMSDVVANESSRDEEGNQIMITIQDDLTHHTYGHQEHRQELVLSQHMNHHLEQNPQRQQEQQLQLQPLQDSHQGQQENQVQENETLNLCVESSRFCAHMKSGKRMYKSLCVQCSDCGHGKIPANCSICRGCPHNFVKSKCKDILYSYFLNYFLSYYLFVFHSCIQ